MKPRSDSLRQAKLIRELGWCGHVTGASPFDTACIMQIGHDGGVHEVPAAEAEASRHATVRAFHQRFGHPVLERPTVPDEATVRFRLALIVEEVEELFSAAGYRFAKP